MLWAARTSTSSRASPTTPGARAAKSTPRARWCSSSWRCSNRARGCGCATPPAAPGGCSSRSRSTCARAEETLARSPSTGRRRTPRPGDLSDAPLHGLPGARFSTADHPCAPKLLPGNALERYDRVIANPPFSLSDWARGGAAGPVGALRLRARPRARGGTSRSCSTCLRRWTRAARWRWCSRRAPFCGGAEADARRDAARGPRRRGDRAAAQPLSRHPHPRRGAAAAPREAPASRGRGALRRRLPRARRRGAAEPPAPGGHRGSPRPRATVARPRASRAPCRRTRSREGTRRSRWGATSWPRGRGRGEDLAMFARGARRAGPRARRGRGPAMRAALARI